MEKLREENRLLRVHNYEQEVLSGGHSGKVNRERTVTEETGDV
jgi:hypothetical protein